MLWIPGKRCLDLFAGTGALGLEALSRGAQSCSFVERDPVAASTLRANISTLGAERASVIEGDAYRAIDDFPAGSFDLIFLDPPFADARLGELCNRLEDSGILAPGARVYLEAPRDAPEVALPPGWEYKKKATAGNVRYALVAAGNRS